jgi:hypothetical protein
LQDFSSTHPQVLKAVVVKGHQSQEQTPQSLLILSTICSLTFPLSIIITLGIIIWGTGTMLTVNVDLEEVAQALLGVRMAAEPHPTAVTTTTTISVNHHLLIHPCMRIVVVLVASNSIRMLSSSILYSLQAIITISLRDRMTMLSNNNSKLVKPPETPQPKFLT